LYWVPIFPERFAAFQWIGATQAVHRVLRILPFLGALVSHAIVIRGIVAKRR
jgi:hypothetical protein